jgi:hypothetical protein
MAVVVPAVRACAADALPDVTAFPPTFTVASVSVRVGVTVRDATAFGTVAVYATVAEAKAGDSVL